ncbi:MAG: LacI family DNA-binding transcriptional regulator [Euzebyaceae bacterium]|nr:LacI family DNA-binding transcriptional regulator [Euzebyaceae bacterium]
MAASIEDVAARAGVSVATVSRALRGLPNVAPTTRGRVLEAAQVLDYVTNPTASRLAVGRTFTIGMVVPLFTQWFFTQVVAGAEAVLATAGYDVLLYNVSGADGRRRFLDRMPFRKRVDGIIVVDLPLAEDERVTLAGLGTPVVTVGLVTCHFPSVSIDNVAAATTATRHLVNLGHERLALISGVPDDPLRFTAPVDRRTGWRQVLVEKGLDTPMELDVPGHFSLAGGAEAMGQLLALDDPPTGVFAESDEMAIGAMKAARELGARVPGDVSIVGFDDHDVAEFFGLTTVAQPVRQQGAVAAEMLLKALAAGAADTPDRVVLPTRLRVRSTTGSVRPSRRERDLAARA